MSSVVHKVWNWFSYENLEPTYGKMVDVAEMISDQHVDVEKERKARECVKIDSDIIKNPVFSEVTANYEKKITKRIQDCQEECIVICNPYGYAPLTALICVKSETAPHIRVTVKGKTEKTTISWEFEVGEKNHRIPVVGLYPAWNNTVTIEEFQENGDVKTYDVSIQTKGLPESLKDAVCVVKHREKSAMPLILVSGKAVPLPYAFDEDGEIRYYLEYRPKGYGVLPLSGGRFILVDKNVLVPTYQLPHSTQIYEMDYFGRVFKTYYVPKGCHHDVIEMEPGGNLLMISNSIEGHVGDVVLELHRTTGQIVNKIDMRQIFGDTYRDRINWTHLNALIYQKDEDALIISARNLHSLVKIQYSTGELQWILGDPHFWRMTPFRKKVLRPIGEVKWFYQQHAPVQIESERLTGNKNINIMVFDNHWHKRRKVSNFDYDPKSYVKIFSINEEKRNVKMIHSYPTLKSKITSNPAIDLSKRRVFSMGAYLEPMFDGRGGMIDEFDLDTQIRLNRYSIKHFYYRAIKPDFNLGEMSKPFCMPKEPCIGFLRKPEQQAEFVQEPPKDSLHDIHYQKREALTFSYVDDVLRIGTKDHLLEKVWLTGDKSQYLLDLTRPKQTDAKFSEIVYAVAIPLHTLEDDSYKIWVQFKGKCYDTEHFVNITHK